MNTEEVAKLVKARANYVQQLLDLSDPCRKKPTYSIAGRSVPWTEYQAFLKQQITDLDAMIAAAGGDGDPPYIVTAAE